MQYPAKWHHYVARFFVLPCYTTAAHTYGALLWYTAVWPRCGLCLDAMLFYVCYYFVEVAEDHADGSIGSSVVYCYPLSVA